MPEPNHIHFRCQSCGSHETMVRRRDDPPTYHCPACGKANTPSDSTMRRAREHVE